MNELKVHAGCPGVLEERVEKLEVCTGRLISLADCF